MRELKEKNVSYIHESKQKSNHKNNSMYKIMKGCNGFDAGVGAKILWYCAIVVSCINILIFIGRLLEECT